MLYEKCRSCKYTCRCCSSYFKETWPKCSKCPNNNIEFEPAFHIIYCPLDGQKIQRPLYDINGHIISEA